MLYKNDRRFLAVAHIVMIVLMIFILFPFALLISASFTDETAALQQGFSLIPPVFSTAAYQYVLREWRQIGGAYLMSLIVTLIGTVVSLCISSMLAYGLSRKIRGQGVFAFLVVFTMLFNGGLVPTYYVYANLLDIKNTIWALIVPGLLMNAFTIMLIRNYYLVNIPEALLESARIDGAGEMRTFMRIVLPLSTPILATMGLMTAIAYWNDWQNGLYYVDNSKLYTLQLLLNKINDNASYLAANSTQMGAITVGQTALPTTTMRMAVAVIGIVPILSVYPFFQKYFVKGITLGAVKG